jgi:hypothetical protein
LRGRSLNTPTWAETRSARAATATIDPFSRVTDSTTPSFATEVEFTTGSGVPSVVVADFNGDGKPDLAVSNSHSGTVSVLLSTTAMGAATPSFAPKVDLAGGSQDSGLYAAAGDVNGDGKPDLVVANYGSKTVSVFLNTTVTNATAPSFATGMTFPDASGPAALAISDLNGDGKPDLACANYDSSTLSVLLDTTTMGATIPSFALEVEFATNSGNPSVAISDLNGDGKPDLAVTNSNAADVAVLVNTTASGATTPSFAAKIDFTTSPQPGAIAIDDLNGDGKPDLAVVIFANAVAILLAQ